MVAYGIACDITGADPGLLGRIEASASAAEQAGFASWWAGGDREQVASGGHDAVLTLQCAARATERLGLRLSGDVPVVRSPAVRAKQVASLDWFSQGRLEYGLDLGPVPDALRDQDDDLDAAAEHLAAMRALWSQRRAVFEGERVAFRGAIALPRPAKMRVHVRHGDRPVLDLLAQQADGWLGWLVPAEELPVTLGELNEALAEAGEAEVRRTWLVAAAEFARAKELLAKEPSLGVDELVAVFGELPAPERVRELA
ncbi:LLM class flavin-dependent oxidoreductase [Acrocarpospora catenulata]|uniref:LLM class flavin-dependent oxidoreductase n=1 Tax=Acrocarpospora catenulata TaxID=2836182 RepID=UPI001BD9ED40|nr:LLM class flavin-dependent oxidoreductase [Acrocarpospora catenulata]